MVTSIPSLLQLLAEFFQDRLQTTYPHGEGKEGFTTRGTETTERTAEERVTQIIKR
jgi:hypothetical protein